MEAGVRAQPQSPTGQFGRRRLSGRFPGPETPRGVPSSLSDETPPGPGRPPPLRLEYPSPASPDAHAQSARCARPALQRGAQRPRSRVRVPADSLRPPRAVGSPSPAHLSGSGSGGERRGGGEGAGRQGRGRRRARRPRLSGPPPSRWPQGGRARRVTLGGGSSPVPSLAAPGAAGAPPVRLCRGLPEYVCPRRASALTPGGGGEGRRRGRGGGGGGAVGESARTWLLTPVRNVSD